MNLKSLFFGWRYRIEVFIFRIHDNGYVVERDKGRLCQNKGVFFYEFLEHSSWRKIKDEYVVTSNGKPMLFLFQTIQGVYEPIKFMTDFGEFTPDTMKQLEREVFQAKEIIEPIQREIDNIPQPNPQASDYQQQLKIYELKVKDVIDKVGKKEYEAAKKKGNKAYTKLQKVKAYFYIPKEESKHWFGVKVKETYENYPSRGAMLKKYLPIGIMIIGLVLLVIFWPKIKEAILGLM